MARVYGVLAPIQTAIVQRRHVALAAEASLRTLAEEFWLCGAANSLASPAVATLFSTAYERPWQLAWNCGAFFAEVIGVGVQFS
jgi:hypothetical protein